MISIYPTTLNIHETHRLAPLLVDELSKYSKDICRALSLEDADVVFINAPAVFPWELRKEEAERIIQLGKKIAIVDDSDYIHWGGQIESWKQVLNLFKNQIVFGFIRDLLPKDIKETSFPIFPYELVGYGDLERKPFIHISEKSDYLRRPVDVFLWGAIHPGSRSLMSGALEKCDLHTIIWDTSLHRKSMKEVYSVQSNSKITLAMEGSVGKTQKYQEACVNTAMAMDGTDFIWSFPWKAYSNCIFLPVSSIMGENNRKLIDAEKSVGVLKEILKNPDQLYNIYLGSQEQARLYDLDYYYGKYMSTIFRRYLEGEI